MKKIFLLFLSLSVSAVFAGDVRVNHKRARVRDCQEARWTPPRLRAAKPGPKAALDFEIKEDTSGCNALWVEITPYNGKFLKGNFLLALWGEEKNTVNLRPADTKPGEELTRRKKNILIFNLPQSGKKYFRMRLHLNYRGSFTPMDFQVNSIRFTNIFRPRRHADFKPMNKIDTPDVVLLKDEERGFTAKEALFNNYLFGKRTNDRPAPIAKLPGDDRITGSGTVEKESIPVEFLEESAAARQAQLRFGVPFSPGKVFSVKNLRLIDEKGREIPAQISPLVRHPDNSLRHVFVTAFADFKAKEKRVFRLEYGNQVRALPVKGIRYDFNGETLTVDAGCLKGTIRRKGFNFSDALTVNGKTPGRFLPAEITLADGRKFTLASPDRFELIEAGPLRLTLRAAGRYTGPAGSYVARVTFLYNKPRIEVDFTHINSETDLEYTDFKSLYLHFAPSGKVRDISVFQETEKKYSDGGKQIAAAHPGAFTVAENCGIVLCDWHQRYPKSLTSGNGKVSVGLLPVHPGKDFNADLPWKLKYLYTANGYRMKWGMSFTERLTFNFDNTPAKILEAEKDMPLIAVLPAAYYRKTGIIPDDDNLAPVDAGITDAFNRYIARQKNEREFGFFNYGDSFGERGFSWTNNEYDPAQSIAEAFLRTGNRDMLRYVLVTSRHQADVDTCHAYPDPYFIGSNVQHGIGHTGLNNYWSFLYHRYTAASGGHSWTRGRLWAWLLCADTVVMDSTLLFGDHTAFAVIPNYKSIIGEAPREIGWMLRGMVPLYEVTRDPLYLKAIRQAAALAVKECAYEKGAWPRINRRLRRSYRILDKGNVTYQAALMLKGLCDYHALTGDPAVRRAITTTARWIIKAYAPGESAGFYYDLSADGRALNWPFNGLNSLISPPLAEAAVIADDPEIFAIAQKSMAKILLNEHPISHKYFALELTFITDYLRAVAAWNKKHGIKSDYSAEALKKLYFSGKPQTMRIRGASVWNLVSRKDDAQVSLIRWIRSGNPKTPVKVILKDRTGKVLEEKNLPPHLNQQHLDLQLPGKKSSRFTLHITDAFGADWSISQDSPVRYAVRMQQGGLPVSHIGLHRFYARIPAGTSPLIRYSGSHAGEWSIQVLDGKKEYKKSGFLQTVSVSKFLSAPAEIRLPASSRDRTIELICSAVLDGRIFISGVSEISTTCR